MQRSKIDTLAQAKGITPEEFVQSVLSEHGSIRRVAKELQISRITLQRWIRREGYSVRRCVRLERK